MYFKKYLTFSSMDNVTQQQTAKQNATNESSFEKKPYLMNIILLLHSGKISTNGCLLF